MIIKILCAFIAIIILAGCERIEECSEIRGLIDEYCIPDSNLSISSPGGNGSIAIQIAEGVEFTHVDGNCLSSCVIVASAGIERSACHDVWFGFHQPKSSIGTEKLLAFFKADKRINYDYVESLILSTPNETMSNIPAWRALENGLIDQIVQCD